MSPILYDLRRTLTGKFTILLIILIVGFTALGAYTMSSSGSGHTSPGNIYHTDVGYYHSNGTYHIVTYTFDGYGTPVINTPISLSVNKTFYNGTSNSAGFYNSSLKSNESRIPVDAGVIVNASASSFLVEPGFAFMQTNMSLINATTSLRITLINQPGSLVYKMYNLFYVGPNDSRSPQLNAYYKAYNSSAAATKAYYGNNLSTSANMTRIGAVGDFYTSSLKVPLTTSNQNSTFVLEFFNATTDKLVTSYPPVDLYTHISRVNQFSTVFAFLSGLYGFFIPIMAIFSSYLYYGKDRTSGVLESVATRPVTKSRILASRFAAVILSIFIALVISISVANILLAQYFGQMLPLSDVFGMVGIFLVVSAAFAGIVFLTSQLSRAQGTVLGVGIVMFIVFDMLWTFLILDLLLFYVFKLSPLAPSTGVVTAILDAINPAGFSSIASSLVTGTFTAGFNSYPASTVGITMVSVSIVGAIWLIVPFAITYYLSRIRD
ncbi:MAG: ABC transporter permease [Candidatus Thermoplasmatota archaeon]|nr:ABC transporter permease [Candidatus Thermoplasmatota archaeon]